MDSQATGWDKAFMTQSWNAQTTELSAGWNQAYAAITRSNDFLSGLGTADKVSDDVKDRWKAKHVPSALTSTSG